MNTEKLTTDELFTALPSFINKNGMLYHFELIKGNKRVIISYRNEYGKYLADTSRGSKTLNKALKSMLDWLIEFGYYDLKSENILIDMINQVPENKQ